jgi:LPS export ABC transporter protein LptC
MRSRVRLLVVASILIVLGAGAALVGRSLWRQHRSDVARAALDMLPDVTQRIRDFHRVKVDDGRKIWEVAAKEARYLEDEQLVVVEQPLVSVFLRDGRVVALRGKRGRVFLGGRDLEAVELSGQIDVRLGDYTLRSDFARYDRGRDLITVPGDVEITGDGLELHGKQMAIDVKAQHLKLARDVRMTLEPRS